nr:hypothetical protein [Tanacetum cinerariifolium]
MDLFSLISAPNPAKVKTRTHPRTAHEVPLLTATANRVIDMEDMIGASGSSRTPSTIEKSPLDFSNEDPPLLITESIRAEEQGQDEMYYRAAPVGNPPYTGVALEPDLEKETVDIGGKSLASIGIGTGTTVSAPATQEIPVHTEGMSDPDPLSYAKPRPAPEQDVAQKAVTKLLKKAVAQVARRDQRIEAREKHIRNLEALLEAEVDMKGVAEAKNVELAKERESAHEVPLLTATANRVIDMEDMIGASGSSRTPSTIEKSPLDFSNEDPPLLITESIRAEEQGQDEMYYRAAPVGNPPYTGVALEPDLEKETVDTGALVSKRRRKRGLDESTLGGKSLASIGIGTGTTVSAPATQEIPVHTEGMSDPDPLSYAKPRPAPEQDVAQLDALSIDFNEELYLHMLTTIAGRRWIIGHGLRLAVMKCAEST